MDKTLIYVEVLGTPGGALVATAAEQLHRNCFRMLRTSPDPEHVYWRFEAPDVVRCVEYQFAEGETGWLAVGPCRCNARWETTSEPAQRDELLLQEYRPAGVVLLRYEARRVTLQLQNLIKSGEISCVASPAFLVGEGCSFLRCTPYVRRARLNVLDDDTGCRILDEGGELEIRCRQVGLGWGPDMADNLKWILHNSNHPEPRFPT